MKKKQRKKKLKQNRELFAACQNANVNGQWQKTQNPQLQQKQTAVEEEDERGEDGVEVAAAEANGSVKSDKRIN